MDCCYGINYVVVPRGCTWYAVFSYTSIRVILANEQNIKRLSVGDDCIDLIPHPHKYIVT